MNNAFYSRTNHKNAVFYLIWILVGVIGRLIIHVPDVTPLTSLALLAPTVFSKRVSLTLMLSILIVSDYLLHVFFHYPVFGAWTYFTYSGWLMVVMGGFIFSRKSTVISALWFTLLSSVFFWIWTNAGTWCTSGMYPHTTVGLIACFDMALPFLKYSILGSLAWTAVLMFGMKTRRSSHNPSHSHAFTTTWDDPIEFPPIS